MKGTAYFTPELFVFLKQLRRHNNREWFLKNKPRYETLAKAPALRFIGDLSLRIGEISPSLVAGPKSLFRIYRDVRFSSDKSPYKTHVAMQFSHAAAVKDVHAPGYYLHLEPGSCFAAAGSWHPDPRSLAKIRDAIAWQQDDWKQVRRRVSLSDLETLSRPPRGYSAEHPFIEDLKRKDFIATVDFSESDVCSPAFLREFLGACKRTAPLVAFLAKALKLGF